MRPRCPKCGKSNLVYVDTMTSRTTTTITVTCQMCGKRSTLELINRFRPEEEENDG